MSTDLLWSLWGACVVVVCAVLGARAIARRISGWEARK